MQTSLRSSRALGPARKIGGIKATRPCVSRRALPVKNQSCLIINTKGGGHAFIGLHLAQELLKRGHTVTICNDGDNTKLSSKAPFSQYSQLERQGATVTWGSPTDPSTWPKGDFEVVYDNNGKDLESCKPLIDQHMGKAKHYVFVGSAGAYNANSIEPCHYEGDARKASAGHVEVEKYLELINMPYTVFQPLYIYGPHTAKDCEQWFIDRIARDRPVPIPAPGIQLTTLTHVEDVATMLASVPGNPNAVGQHYNVCSDRCISFVGIVNAISKAMGKEPNVLLYDPAALGLGKSGKAEGFPFRTIHFFANSDKAKMELGWQPKHSFVGDVNDLVDAYFASGRDKKDIDFSIDDKIIQAMRK
mmetsp:Transcript_1971/g.4448  ORF Transcript_1971/g.4448 Transcript_1971/m.4448 type:complete len:360 (+) Transcript_1971:37-1116(+)